MSAHSSPLKAFSVVSDRMSFATLDEAWGGVGAIQVAQVARRTERQKADIEPEPSDASFGKYGAPIMDDIVTLYAADRPDLPDKLQQKALVQPVSAPLIREGSSATGRVTDKRLRRMKGDDYDSDGSEEQGSVRPDRVDRRRRIRMLERRREYVGADDDTPLLIELAAYVLSGVILIFLFESFITIGSNMHMHTGRQY